jgi:poly-gamma-glutamate synthesis protein (capsule biosynthesis protein)
MKSININNITRKSKSKKFPYILIIVLTIIAILLYFYITDKASTVNAIEFLFTKKNQISYKTYDVYLENLGETHLSEIKENLESIKFEDINRFNFVDKKESSDIILGYGQGENEIYSKYLLPVGYIYWINQSISSEDLENGKYKVLLNEGDYNEYANFFKTNYQDMVIESSSNLLSQLEDEDCGCIGLIEDDELSKEYKLLKVDDKYYLDTFDSGIKVSIVTQSNNKNINLAFVSNILERNIGLADTEFNEDTIAKVNMTGVTALARRVAEAMAIRNNYSYPAEKISSFLSDADLTHTSNEISFVDGCTTYSGMRFCSSPKSIEALKAIGADLIELTGNHNNDFGSSNNTRTIEDYKNEGMAYFGGGLDTEDARKPYIVEIDGNKIAFLGYNYYDAIVAGGTNALAGTNKAGANPYSEEHLREDIENVRDDVDIVIVDFQYQECYSYPSSDVIYPVCYKPIGSQSSVFREAIDYGANIVIGTQAHQPQTYELYDDGIIFYGLGNLFFDQSMWIGTRQGMILTHYFKNGELIQTKITPTIYDSSLQVEIANDSDADLLLELLKTARKSL